MASWSEKVAAIKAVARNGIVDPRDLIEAARNANHPCHEDFTWDVESAAAERWRDQARALIRRVKFEVVMDDVSISVPQYVAETRDDEPLFTSITRMRSTESVSDLLASEMAMLLGNARRVRGIAASRKEVIGEEMFAKLQAICTMIEQSQLLLCDLRSRRLRKGSAGLVPAGIGGRGVAGLCRARPGMAVAAWPVEARRVRDWRGGRGLARLGWAWLFRAVLGGLKRLSEWLQHGFDSRADKFPA